MVQLKYCTSRNTNVPKPSSQNFYRVLHKLGLDEIRLNLILFRDNKIIKHMPAFYAVVFQDIRILFKKEIKKKAKTVMNQSNS